MVHKDVNIGLALWSVRDHLAQDQAGTLARAAEIGFTGVEPFRLGDPAMSRAERLEAARRLRADLDDAHLVTTSAHTRFPALTEVDWLLEEMAVIGVPLAIASVPDHVLGFGRDAFTSYDRLARFTETFNALADTARSHGLQLGYHNHWWDWNPLPDGRPGYEVLFEGLAADVVAEVDLYWATAAGRDPVRVLDAVGERAQILHAKDGPGQPGVDQSPLGQGTVRLDESLAAAVHAQWVLVELDYAAQDSFDVVTSGYAWLRDNLKRAEKT